MDCTLINQLTVGSWDYTAGNWTAYPITYKEKETELGLAEALNVSVLCKGSGRALKPPTNRGARLVWPMRLMATTAAFARWLVALLLSVVLPVVCRGPAALLFHDGTAGEDFGMFLQVSFELVDAAQWVAIYNREQEINNADGVVYCGDFTLGARC